MSQRFNRSLTSVNIELNTQPSDLRRLQYVLILGKGRSGTTWLAQIMNTYEHCTYKHEPFLPIKSTDYNEWLKDLVSTDAEAMDVEASRSRLDLICQRCYHDVDMPPFPPKSFRTQHGGLLHLLYGLGKRSNPIKSLYEWYGRVNLTQTNPVLIKDVNFQNELLSKLCGAIAPYLLVVVRNPFGNISSYLKGVELNLFAGAKRQDVEKVRSTIETLSRDDLNSYSGCLETMSNAEFEALRWRIEVEPLVEFARTYDRGLVVVYENLCTEPHTVASEIFDFVGWELSQATRDFINMSTSGESKRSGSAKSYYSVYRNPSQSLSKWKTQLSADQIEDIAKVIRTSPLRDLWYDLPL